MNTHTTQIETQLLQLEKQFWKGDAGFYRQHLAEDSLMVFAKPTSMLTRDAILQSIAGGPRWHTVSFSEVRLLPLSDSIVAVIYSASARRRGDEVAYSALASSVYVNESGAWKLALHQQTPDSRSD